jgi:hypothetical protein
MARIEPSKVSRTEVQCLAYAFERERLPAPRSFSSHCTHLMPTSIGGLAILGPGRAADVWRGSDAGGRRLRRRPSYKIYVLRLFCGIFL